MQRNAGVGHCDPVSRPAELVLDNHCLHADCLSFGKDASVGAAVFPRDVKLLSKATLVTFLQCLYMTALND